MQSRKWFIAIPIIVVMLALCGAMVWLGYFAVRQLANADGLYIFSWRIQDTPAEAEESQTYPAADALVVNNACANIQVTGGTGSEIALTMHKKAWGSDEAEARAALEKIQLEVKEEDGKLLVGLKNADKLCSGRNMRPPVITLIFQTPESTPVQAETEFGDITLTGVKARVELHSQFGNIEARQVAGPLTANSGNGRLSIEDIRAEGELISLNSNFGDINLRQAQAGRLDVQAGNGQVAINDVDVSGAAMISGDFGDQTWHAGAAQSLEVQTKNGRIDLQGLEVVEGVKLTSNFGDIDLQNVTAANYIISTKNGRVTVAGATGHVTAQSDFGDISVQATQAVSFDLTSQNGAIAFTGALGSDDSRANTRFGNVRIQLPADSAFNFDLQTNFGKISSDFEVQIKGTPNETHWQGSVADGGPVVTVETQNGNIEIVEEGA